MSPLLIGLYLAPVVGIFGWYAYSRRRKEAAAILAAEEAIAASLTEPPTLHPVIDPTKCIGCRSCVAPEPVTAQVMMTFLFMK